ncbi:MAG TPA: hypothetical protein VMF11_01810 [Candidatus Baltobacteraceae bacterium]|nr:hypothetical protein [Candidatus Baltobacteraceae bacterium]
MRALAGASLALLLAAAPQPSSSPQQTQWLGITLGETQANVYARFGEAGFVAQLADGDNFIAYALDEGRAAFYVGFHRGYVVSMQLARPVFARPSIPASALADPLGITLGMHLSEVVGKRGPGRQTIDARQRPTLTYSDPSGATWTYAFRNDLVDSIAFAAPKDAFDGLPRASAPATHGGTSFADALLDGATDEFSGAMDEEMYLLTLRCNKNGDAFREASQALANYEGHPYDVLHLVCPRGDETRDIYFAIGSFFGKM